jgi:iron(II)-dependent oxidoreductase
MQIGNLAWVAGWTSLSVLLAFAASVLGPGPTDRPAEPAAMIRVPGGSFMLGAEDDAPDQRPVQRVELGAFEIDRVPIVNAQFAVFLNEHDGETAGQGPLLDLDAGMSKIIKIGTRYVAVAGFEQYPVIAETWQGARAYCAARGTRLPTEAEWERAARGPEGRLYPWGNEPPDASRARFDYKIFDYRPVGSYPAGATPDGILDMAGNVAQWTSSRYLPYPYRADDGREDPDATGERVTRGGGASATAGTLRSSYRSVGMLQLQPAGRPPVTFRCARDAE